MKKIKVTRGGVGIAYKDKNGIPRYILKTAADGEFECDDIQANRYISRGVCAAVSEESNFTPVTATSESENSGRQDEKYNVDELEQLSFLKLKSIAKKIGIDTSDIHSKDDLIFVITNSVKDNDDSFDNSPPVINADSIIV